MGTSLSDLASAAVPIVAIAWLTRHAILITYVSAILATLLSPIVDRVQRVSLFGRKPGRGVAVVLLLGCVTAVIVVIAVFALPPLVRDLRDFASDLPRKLGQLRDRLPFLHEIDPAKLQSSLVSGAGGLVSFLGGVGGSVLDTLSAALLTAYFILDGPALLQGGLVFLPAPQRSRLEDALTRAARRMRGWLAGQAMLMAILGGSSLVTFGFMRVPYFYLLAAFAGIANIVPLLGPLATVVVAGLAAADSPWKALGVLVFYLVYQQVENAFLTPWIMKWQVQLPSAVVLLALLFAGELAGIAGALVAVPSAVLVAELAKEYREA